MPVLPNARYERFAQELADGKQADAAYVAAGFKSNPGNARRLKMNEAVMKRVEALLIEREAMHAEATVMATKALSIDKQWLIEKAEEARLMAMENKQSSAAIAAVKELGILSGFRVVKQENLNSRPVEKLTDEELDEMIRSGYEEWLAAGKPKCTH